MEDIVIPCGKILEMVVTKKVSEKDVTLTSRDWISLCSFAASIANL